MAYHTADTPFWEVGVEGLTVGLLGTRGWGSGSAFDGTAHTRFLLSSSLPTHHTNDITTRHNTLSTLHLQHAVMDHGISHTERSVLIASYKGCDSMGMERVLLRVRLDLDLVAVLY